MEDVMYPVALVTLAVIAVIFMFVLVNIWGMMLKKVPPNQALIKYGRNGVQVITGGAGWVWPFFERSVLVSLEVMPFDLAVTSSLWTDDDDSVLLSARALLKVCKDQESILLAAEQFMSKSQNERQALLQSVLESHLRGLAGHLNIEQLVREPATVSEWMRQSSASDLTRMGLELISFTITTVQQKRGEESAQTGHSIFSQVLE
jgi:flotillin